MEYVIHNWLTLSHLLYVLWHVQRKMKAVPARLLL